MVKLFILLTLCSSVAAETSRSPAVPQPEMAPEAWELRFRYQDPQRISVVVPGEEKPVTYWYMVYSVENPTRTTVDFYRKNKRSEIEFYPEFEIVTDRFEVIKSEISVSPAAFRAIYHQVGNPLLVPPERVTGRLLSGRDQRRQSVAIWRDFSPEARKFTVYVKGLSGEMIRWKNPAFDADQPESEDNQRYFLLRKTLAIPYRLPGSAASRRQAVPKRLVDEQAWVMR